MNHIANTLLNGGVGVIPTDTIHGLVARAEDKEAVERVYLVKGRQPEKPCLILISSISDLERFDIYPQEKLLQQLDAHWPGKVSVILNCPGERFEYLHRGKASLGFRLPDKPGLLGLLKKTGPLIAPSANPEGLPPAKNIEEAKAYFRDNVDFYVGGETSGKPSKIISLVGGNIEVLR